MTLLPVQSDKEPIRGYGAAVAIGPMARDHPDPRDYDRNEQDNEAPDEHDKEKEPPDLKRAPEQSPRTKPPDRDGHGYDLQGSAPHQGYAPHKALHPTRPYVHKGPATTKTLQPLGLGTPHGSIPCKALKPLTHPPTAIKNLPEEGKPEAEAQEDAQATTSKEPQELTRPGDSRKVHR